MEVISPRAALLSNFEVLGLLRELESDHLAKARTALRIKKEEEASANAATRTHAAAEEVPENLRTVEVEAIQYLAADYQPTALQSETGIAQLTRNLAAYDLTKAEKLQVVNLAPVEAVELYVIVEELEDRFGDRLDDILSTVRASLSDPSPAADVAATNGTEPLFYPEPPEFPGETSGWEPDANDMVFDDTGEGMGVEGDLDVEED